MDRNTSRYTHLLREVPAGAGPAGLLAACEVVLGEARLELFLRLDKLLLLLRWDRVEGRDGCLGLGVARVQAEGGGVAG
jgi:hypothetical protein